MDVTELYETVAQVSFTVLGLWLVVAEVMRGRASRVVDWRLAHAISLQLALLGTQSLLSQIDPDDAQVWRFAYGIGGLLTAGLVYLRAVRRRTEMTSITWFTAVGLVVVNLVTVVVAVTPDGALRDLGSSLTAIQAEAILVSLLVLLVMNLAIWFIFEPSAGQ